MNNKGLFEKTGNAISMDDLDTENPAPVVKDTAIISPESTQSTTQEKELKNEAPTEVKTEPEVITSPPASTEVGLDAVNKFFEQKFGRKFESEDALKSVLTTESKATEYAESQKALTELKEKFDILLNQVDPKSLFASDEAYKLEQFKKQNPDKDPVVATEIFSKDLKSLDDYDVVKLGFKMNYPRIKGGEEGLESTIADELGVDPLLDIKDWPDSKQNRLAKMASDYRKSFEHMKQVEGPKSIDVESIRQQMKTESEAISKSLKENWDKATPVIASDTKSLKIQINDPKEGEQPVYFEWDLGDGAKAEVDAIVNGMIASGSMPNEDALPSVKEAVQMAAFWKNRAKIIPAIIKDIESRAEAKHLQETNNTTPLKDTERTDTNADKQKADLSEYVRSNDQERFQRRKFNIV